MTYVLHRFLQYKNTVVNGHLKKGGMCIKELKYFEF